MKKFVLSAALVVAGVAGSAFGQPTAAAIANYSLDLAIVARDGVVDDVTGLTDNTGPITLAAGASQRFAVRYRVRGGANGTTQAPGFVYRGFAAVSFNITSTSAFNTGTWSSALLTNNQTSGSVSTDGNLAALSGSGWDDLSGDPLSGDLGLHTPFRTGIFTGSPDSNGDFANNGASTLGIFNVLPLGTASFGATLNRWYGVYDFVFTNTSPTAQTVTLSATGDPSQSAFFLRSGTTDFSQAFSNAYTSTPISFDVEAVPAPASAALLGLGGLVAARRRRA